MQITFDPTIPDECAVIARLLGTTAPVETFTQTVESFDEPDIKGSGTYDDPLDYSGVKTVEGPPPGQPDTPEPDTSGTLETVTTDIHGMAHDEAIHSTPPSKNADGSWRARRGKKDEYEAAIAAHNGTPAEAVPEQPEQPAMPAASEPIAPPAPVDYKTMASRFVAKMQDPEGLPSDYETIYKALEIGFDDLQTNQTSIARLHEYMNAVDEGLDHAGSVRHALGEVSE